MSIFTTDVFSFLKKGVACAAIAATVTLGAASTASACACADPENCPEVEYPVREHSFNQTGLIGVWHFDEVLGSEIIDATGQYKNGSIPTTVERVSGRSGNALLFKSLSSANVSDVREIGVLTELTVETWVKTTASKNHVAVQKWYSGDVTGSFLLSIYDNGLPTFAIFREGQKKADYLKGKNKINDGEWHHLAGVYDGTELVIYVDGQEAARMEAPGVIKETNHPLYIGGNSKHEFDFDGTLDEVKIHRKALAAEDIRTEAL